jgi:hypothetical protein
VAARDKLLVPVGPDVSSLERPQVSAWLVEIFPHLVQPRSQALVRMT